MKGRQGENPGEVGLTAKKKVYFFFLGSAFFSGFFAMVNHLHSLRGLEFFIVLKYISTF
jgi:hypothetical protein